MPNLNSRIKAGSAFLGGVLLIAACGSTSPLPQPEPQPEPSEQVGAILGRVTPPEGARRVQTAIEGIGTSVDTEGKFGLALPNAATMTSTYREELFPVYRPPTPPNEFGDSVFGLCQDVTEDAPDDLLVFPINELRTDTGRTLVQDRGQLSDSSDKITTWWFSSQDVTFSFKGNCIPLGQIDTTLTFKRGWNAVATEYFGDRTTYTVVEQPQTVQPWTDYGAAIGNLSLHPNILAPWKSLPQYRNR